MDNDWGNDDDAWGDFGDNDDKKDSEKRDNFFYNQDTDGDKKEDKFNQVMAGSKEKGGLLASIGLKKDAAGDESIQDDSQEEDLHKKSDYFDTSKDRIENNNNDAGK